MFGVEFGLLGFDSSNFVVVVGVRRVFSGSLRTAKFTQGSPAHSSVKR